GASAVTLRAVSRHWFGHCPRPGRGGADVLAHPFVFRPSPDGQRGFRCGLPPLGGGGGAARRALRRPERGPLLRRRCPQPLSQRVLANLRGLGGLSAGRQSRSPCRPPAEQRRFLSRRPFFHGLSPRGRRHGMVRVVRSTASPRADPFSDVTTPPVAAKIV